MPQIVSILLLKMAYLWMKEVNKLHKLTFGAKVVKFVTKISVFLTVMAILIAIPVGVAATVYYAYKMSVMSVFYALITLLLLKIREKVVG